MESGGINETSFSQNLEQKKYGGESDETIGERPTLRMTGRQKAAALMVALGSDACAKVFKELDNTEVEIIASEIALMQHVDADAISFVFEEFKETISSGGTGVQGGVSYATEVLSKALGTENSADSLEKIRATSSRMPFDHLAESADSIELLMEMMQGENPQTIALVVTHIKEQNAAQILSSLPPDLQTEVIMRISNMTTVSPEVLSQMEDILEAKFQRQETSMVGGFKAAADILNHVEADVEKYVMDSISDSDPEMAKGISEHMFTYDDIALIPDIGIQKLIQEVDENDLLMSLKASTEDIKSKLFNNMSERRREMVEEDLEKMPPAKLKDVLSAQKRILAVVKELCQSGQIEIVRDAEQETYV